MPKIDIGTPTELARKYLDFIVEAALILVICTDEAPFMA